MLFQYTGSNALLGSCMYMYMYIPRMVYYCVYIYNHPYCSTSCIQIPSSLQSVRVYCEMHMSVVKQSGRQDNESRQTWEKLFFSSTHVVMHCQAAACTHMFLEWYTTRRYTITQIVVLAAYSTADSQYASAHAHMCSIMCLTWVHCTYTFIRGETTLSLSLHNI